MPAPRQARRSIVSHPRAWAKGQQHAQERGLARADAPRDNSERATLQTNVNAVYAAPRVGVGVGLLERLEGVETMPSLLGDMLYPREWATHIDWARLHQACRWRVGLQLEHAVD